MCKRNELIRSVFTTMNSEPSAQGVENVFQVTEVILQTDDQNIWREYVMKEVILHKRRSTMKLTAAIRKMQIISRTCNAE